MSNRTLLLATTLISSMIAAPVFATDDNDDSKRKDRYMQHYQERHQMSLDMMEMLSETMTILRDLNHKPSDAEKERLSKMIKQMDELMARHKEMGNRVKEYMEYRGDDDMHHSRRHGRD